MQFDYAAVLESGKRVSGALKSRSRRDAIRQLLNRGYHPVRVQAARSDRAGRRLADRVFKRISLLDTAVFTRQLAALLNAGMPVTQALSTVRRQSRNRHLASVIQDVEETISRDGGTLADALADHRHVFGPVYCGVVRAGEEGGDQVEVLNNLADHLTKSATLRGQVLGAFIYPVFLLFLGMAAIFVLMTFVIPRFQEVFAGFGQDLPVPTQILISVSGFMSQWWWAVLAGMVTGALLIVAVLRKPAVRRKTDQSVLRLPLFGPMLLKLELSRIARTLAALLNSGVRVLEALRVTAETVKNRALRDTFPAITKAIANGETLAGAAEKTGMFPPLFIGLVRTGEETGGLGEMLTQLCGIYEGESERAITGAVKLVEPCLILLMGGVVTAIVAAVMLPIFQANTMVS